ncbi:MAG: C40 family peptidase [Treponema sp.]|nr:C40 family peptidase [Treponema sp.]
MQRISKIQKILFLFIVFFCLCCVQLCAGVKKMTPEQATEARLKLIEEAQLHIGEPYAYGWAGPNKFDCSGFVSYCFKKALKISVSKSSSGIYGSVEKIDDEELEPGDLVFFEAYKNGKVSHVGIYLGDRKFISAISDGPRTGIQIASLDESYWKKNYMCAGRLLPSGGTGGRIAEGPSSGSTRQGSDNNKTTGLSTGSSSCRGERTIGVFCVFGMPDELYTNVIKGMEIQVYQSFFDKQNFSVGVFGALNYEFMTRTALFPMGVTLNLFDCLSVCAGYNMIFYYDNNEEVEEINDLFFGLGCFSKKFEIGSLKARFVADLRAEFGIGNEENTWILFDKIICTAGIRIAI